MRFIELILISSVFATTPIIQKNSRPNIWNGKKRNCKTRQVSVSERIQIENNVVKKLGNITTTSITFAPIVPVHFHVMTNNGTGAVPLSQMQSQISVLNTAFKSNRSPIRFRLSSYQYRDNITWYNGEDDFTMKNTLRKGGKNALNVYLNGMSNGLLGYATFPWDYQYFPSQDGIVLLAESLPGGNAAPYNLGHTLTHEVGHWIGLFHTFQDGCVASGSRGDMVSDTPAEAEPAFGCPVGRDSCTGTGFAGLDPITNFMDYTDDSCMTKFSPRQVTRMTNQYKAYRY